MRSSLSLGLLLCAAILAPAQTKTELDRDEAEVAAYRLTMPALKKVVQAYRNAAEVAKADPALVQRIEERDKAGERSESANGRFRITEAVRALEAEPKIVAAFKEAGIGVREGMVASASMMLYALAVYAEKASGKLPEIKGLVPENLAFIRQHEAELKDIGAEMQKLNSAFRPAKKSEEQDEEEAEESAE